MAFYVRLEREFEDASQARYRFSADDSNFGRLSIDKLTGAVVLLAGVAGDEHGNLYMRAAAKIRREWRHGRTPDITEWAS